MLETALNKEPSPTHDPVGWPTFKDWPSWSSLTHEQSYYRWVERAWMGGLRVYVNLLVENKVLCEIYPYKKNSCNEMESVRLQAKDIYKMQDYIDAQAGGPGKGFFRIVKDPFEARRVVNDGKLAVVLGIEVSEPFDCQVVNDRPTCDAAKIDRDLDEMYDLGVRDMEIINKFDNALAGVAGDDGSTGAVVNNGNKLETGKYWQMQTCKGHPEGVSDKEQPTVFTHNTDALIGNGIQALLPEWHGARLSGRAALQPARPHRARGARDPPDDREEDDRRPRPPQRPRAQPGAGAARRRPLLRRRVEPQLEHRRRVPAHPPARGRSSPRTPAPRATSSRSGGRSSRCATRATTGASAMAPT